jgi:hypothetical protein
MLGKHDEIDERVRVPRVLVDGLHESGLGLVVLGLKFE